MKITFPSGDTKEYEPGVSALTIAKDISAGLAREVCAAKVNGELVDATRPIQEDALVELLKFTDPEGKEVFWHSSTHVLAQAVKELFPYAKPTIGPVIEDGFYYDFDHEPFSPEDLEKIEKRMKEIAKRKLDVHRKELSKKEAKETFKDNEYKIEIIDQVEEGDTITAYQQGEFIDLCRGPHLPNTGMIKAMKITKVSAAYWRGDAKNASLQRIYGISFPDKKQLNAYLERLEEAKKRDHKKIGREQELFMISELIGKGLPLWLPKGEIIRREVERLALEKEHQADFQRVSTPHLAKEELFMTSGHLPHYGDTMYPHMTMDDGTYYLKAMNCPLHHVIFARKPRSYRNLPLRLAEYGTVYRNELSGTLSGLLRVRMLSMNDAHIYCTKEQVGEEIKAVIRMIQDYYRIFGLEDYYFRLSLWNPDNKDKYIDEAENWEYTQNELRRVLQELDVPYQEAEDEAAFYGPKIDIQFTTVLGREETMSTVQLDFAAKSRFDFEYQDQNNQVNKEVFVIHRAPLSTHERFMAFLIEHYAGKWPLWLSPIQAAVLPVSDKHKTYAEDVAQQLRDAGLRIEVHDEDNTVNKKIRNAQLAQINYILVVGDRETENKTVNVRTRDNVVHGEKPTVDVIAEMVQEAHARQ